MAFTFESCEGRLMVACIRDPIKLSEIPQFGLQLNLKMQAVAAPVLLLIDILGASLLKQDLAASYGTLMRRDNLWVQRVVLWLNGNSILANQMERVVSEAGGDKRRVCRSGDEVITWLGEIADPNERKVLLRYVTAAQARVSNSPLK